MKNLITNLIKNPIISTLLVASLIIPSSSFGIEVIPSSAREYVESREKRLSDYEMKGVNFGDTKIVDCAYQLKSKAPLNTEVIVDFNESVGHNNKDICYGTALIPKR